MASISREQDGARIRDLDIVESIMESLDQGDVTEEQLLRYFQSNVALLSNNILQARARYREYELSELVRQHFPRYLEGRASILSNFRRFSVLKDQVADKFRGAYDSRIPDVVLVPCLGLYSAGGWAAEISGTHYIFVALERLSIDFPMELLLAHEIAHGISEIDQSTVLGGFYNEGHATYVTSELYPGHEDEVYFFDIDRERYARYLGWMDRNRARIHQDATRPFVVLDDTHKLYFTTSFSEYPNIGYVIGFKYLQHLSQRYSLKELRTLGMDDAGNLREFGEFIFGSEFERSEAADC
jgi:hypothetical protein